MLSAHSGPIISLHFSTVTNNNLLLLYALWDQITEVWDYSKSIDINNDDFNSNKDVITSSMSPDQHHIATSTIDDIITM